MIAKTTAAYPKRVRTREVPPTVVPTDHVTACVEELQGRLEQLHAQVRQAQQLATLGLAAATIAHEVNNLLTPVLSYAHAALQADDPALQRKALEVTIKNVDILSAMSTRVLAIGAAKHAKPERVRLRKVIDEAVESLCRDWTKDGIAFSVDLPDDLAAWADPLQLQQVLFNLFLNAREALAESHGGRVTVSGRRTADRVRISVTNTGDGIPPELLPTVFEPLQSSKSGDGNGRPRCTGLGLALCRDLVMENDGTIDVASDPASGTTFTIELPAEAPSR